MQHKRPDEAFASPGVLKLKVLADGRNPKASDAIGVQVRRDEEHDVRVVALRRVVASLRSVP